MAAEGVLRPSFADVDLGAIAHNAGLLAALAAPARLCAVVKADGYGHGAPAVAAAAVAGGAEMLAVALVDEGLELRAAGITAPVLVLSEAPVGAVGELIDADLVPTAYSMAALVALEEAAAARRRRMRVQLKVDTGMNRNGSRPDELVGLAEVVVRSRWLEIGGTWTHFAVADVPADPFTQRQISCFDAALADLRAAGIAPGLVHAANSAATVAFPRARYDMVRCGLALYGYPPGDVLREPLADLRPALSLVSEVRHVAVQPAGSRPSYGRRRELRRESVIATVPLGYADGVPWRLFDGGAEVLVAGQRRPLAGSVTMDQILVDCGSLEVLPGDEVVLIGRQGGEAIWADEWSRRLGTLVWEVLCGIGPRVPRRYHPLPASARSATAT